MSRHVDTCVAAFRTRIMVHIFENFHHCQISEGFSEGFIHKSQCSFEKWKASCKEEELR